MFIGVASAWTPTRHQLNERRHHVMDVRADKCLHTWEFKTAMRDVAASRLRPLWRYWTGQLGKAWALKNRCLPTDPQAIIRYVFPDSTEGAALRVAYCETGGTFNIFAHNASGASGLFQLMPFHWQGKFNPYNPWANSRYALQLSYGGTNWGAWVCQP